MRWAQQGVLLLNATLTVREGHDQAGKTSKFIPRTCKGDIKDLYRNLPVLLDRFWMRSSILGEIQTNMYGKFEGFPM